MSSRLTQQVLSRPGKLFHFILKIHILKILSNTSLGSTSEVKKIAWLPQNLLKWKNRSFLGETIFLNDFNDGRNLYETSMAAAGRDLAVTWAWWGRHLVA
jgi:hypothetical protein